MNVPEEAYGAAYEAPPRPVLDWADLPPSDVYRQIHERRIDAAAPFIAAKAVEDYNSEHTRLVKRGNEQEKRAEKAERERDQAIERVRETMPDQSLPEGTYCICPEHDLLMPFRHVHWEWAVGEGCPVLTGPGEERCGKPVQVTTRSKIIEQARSQERQRVREAQGYLRAAESLYRMADSRASFAEHGLDAFLEQFFAALSILEDSDA